MEYTKHVQTRRTIIVFPLYSAFLSLTAILMSLLMLPSTMFFKVIELSVLLLGCCWGRCLLLMGKGRITSGNSLQILKTWLERIKYGCLTKPACEIDERRAKHQGKRRGSQFLLSEKTRKDLIKKKNQTRRSQGTNLFLFLKQPGLELKPTKVSLGYINRSYWILSCICRS